MAQENLVSLGFDEDHVMKVDTSQPSAAPAEVVAGLSAAAKKKSVLFGLGSGPVTRGGGGH